jgi:hypothetical protein
VTRVAIQLTSGSVHRRRRHRPHCMASNVFLPQSFVYSARASAFSVRAEPHALPGSSFVPNSNANVLFDLSLAILSTHAPCKTKSDCLSIYSTRRFPKSAWPPVSPTLSRLHFVTSRRDRQTSITLYSSKSRQQVLHKPTTPTINPDVLINNGPHSIRNVIPSPDCLYYEGNRRRV